MVFIQDIVRGTELTIASGGPPGGLPAATADPRQTPSPAARLAQARQKIGAPFWPAAHSASLLQPLLLPLCLIWPAGSCGGSSKGVSFVLTWAYELLLAIM